MQARWKWIAITALAPIAWGSTYVVTREFLPAGSPVWGALIRVMPAGLVLLALARHLPTGAWWWRAVVLGVLNVAGFHYLIYVAATHLPASVASTIMATSPIAIALSGWALLGQKPTARAMLAAVVGIGGVVLIVGGASGAIPVGAVLASLAAMLSSSVGFALSTRWATQDGPMGESDVVATTAWQLLAGGLMLLVLAPVVEGAPPALDAGEVIAFGYVSLIATALAFVCWFSGLRHLRADEVGLIGLLNPVSGVILGVLIGGDVITASQGLGIAVVLLSVLVGSAGRRTDPTDHGLRADMVDRDLEPSGV